MEYSTDDYSLANWLVFNGVEFLGAVEYPQAHNHREEDCRHPSHRKRFAFLGDEKLEYFINEWSFPSKDETKICKAFFRAHSIIKKALKDSLDASKI